MALLAIVAPGTLRAHWLRRRPRIDSELRLVLFLIVPLQILLVVEVCAANDAIVFVSMCHR
jgi:hypothetical protein